MTRFTVLAAVFAAIMAPAADVSADGFDHEQPDQLAGLSNALFVPETKLVRADMIQSDEELHRSGVGADMLIQVSAFPGSGMIDPSSRNE